MSAAAGCAVVGLVLLGAGLRAVLSGWAVHVEVVPAPCWIIRTALAVAVWWEPRSRGMTLLLGPVGFSAGALRRSAR